RDCGPMLRLGIQIEEKHGFGAIDSDGFEFHVAVTVSGYGYPFHGLSFRVRPLPAESLRPPKSQESEPDCCELHSVGLALKKGSSNRSISQNRPVTSRTTQNIITTL